MCIYYFENDKIFSSCYKYIKKSYKIGEKVLHEGFEQLDPTSQVNLQLSQLVGELVQVWHLKSQYWQRTVLASEYIPEGQDDTQNLVSTLPK